MFFEGLGHLEILLEAPKPVDRVLLFPSQRLAEVVDEKYYGQDGGVCTVSGWLAGKKHQTNFVALKWLVREEEMGIGGYLDLPRGAFWKLLAI